MCSGWGREPPPEGGVRFHYTVGNPVKSCIRLDLFAQRLRFFSLSCSVYSKFLLCLGRRKFELKRRPAPYALSQAYSLKHEFTKRLQQDQNEKRNRACQCSEKENRRSNHPRVKNDVGMKKIDCLLYLSLKCTILFTVYLETLGALLLLGKKKEAKV